MKIFSKKITGTSLFSAVLFLLYTFFLVMGEIFLQIEQEELKRNFLFFFLFSLFVAIIIFGFLLLLPCPAFSSPKKFVSPQKTFVFSWFLTFFHQLYYFSIYFPGGATIDTNNQFQQVIQQQLNDWHPYLHTLIFFQIPMLFHENLETIVLFQIVFYCFVVAYGLSTLARYGCSLPFLALSLLALSFHPLISNLILIPWKDVAFALFALLSMTQVVHLVCTEGQWISSKKNLMATAISFGICFFMRHNGMLFIVPLLFYLGFRMKQKKRIIQLSLLVFFIVFIVKVPLYHGLKVESPENRVGEVVGLPLTMISSTATYHPEQMPEELRNWIYNIVPEIVLELYFDQCWNSVKWVGEIGEEEIEKAGVVEILKKNYEIFQILPIETLYPFFDVTQMVWRLTASSYIPVYQLPTEANTVFVESSSSRIQLEQDVSCLEEKAPVLFSVGFLTYCFLVYVIWRKNNFWNLFLLILPLFIYNYGTGLLLSGFDYRFFSYTFFITPSICFLLWKESQEKNQQ